MTDSPKKMEKTFLEAVNHFLSNHGELVAPVQTNVSEKQGRHPYDVHFLYELNRDLLSRSKAQLRQDIFVLHELGFKRGGYFVEFGAASGIELSNTYLLEKDFGWRGILAEPARRWHETLQSARNCHIESDCVWHTSGETLRFREADTAELSTIETFVHSDDHGAKRGDGKSYDVSTISLLDLLERHDAPRQIDYLSVDTEGSEYEILKAFDFERYDIRIITVEHNFTPQREQIRKLLSAQGYVRKFENISRFDDWYVRPGAGR